MKRKSVAGSKLLVVMGHTGCGAIKGAIDGVELGNLTDLLENLHPAIEAVQEVPGPRTSKNRPFVDAVATENVRLTVAKIRQMSPVLADLESEGAILITGAMYHLDTAVVEFLE